MNRSSGFVMACVAGVLSAGLSAPLSAQDSAFLACAQHSDRGQRIACLEDALEAATDDDEAQAQPDETSRPAVTRAGEPRAAAPPSRPPADSAPSARVVERDPAEEDPSLLERLRNFGRSEEPTLATDEEGNEELHDTIAQLEKRRNMWVVTLGSGQVWMQQVPRRLNLREGDEVRIYQEGIGDGYRLAAKRLSGFIRVERVK